MATQIPASRKPGAAQTRAAWVALWRWCREHRLFVAGCFVAFAFLVAAILIPVGWLTAGSLSDELSAELAKAGIQIVAVVVIGGVGAAIFRSLDARREDDRRLDDFRAAIVNQLWEAYHAVKAVRRNLRAAGFRPGATGAIDGEQAMAFDDQMRVLNEAQLTLEALKRSVHGQQRLFDRHAVEIACLLTRSERYVRRVVQDWEKRGDGVRRRQITLDELMDPARTPLGRFCGFVGTASPASDWQLADESCTSLVRVSRTQLGVGIKVGLSNRVERAAHLIQSVRFR